jgi:hypothetical protein
VTDIRRYASPTAFRQAIEGRLKQWAKEEGGDLSRYRRQLAFDRLLARLFSTATPWVLKGGYAMELRSAAARSTVDLDLSFREPWLLPQDEISSTLLAMLRSAARQDLNDFFAFEIGEVLMDLEAAPYGGARYPVTALMDGRTFARFHLDVGVGDIVFDPLEQIAGRDWLSFTGIAPQPVWMISKEQQFAEKLHAYSLPRQGTNSRVKDLVDMVLLINSKEMRPDRIRGAIIATFERRKTHPIPSILDRPPDAWAKPYAALASECGLSEGLDEAIALVQNQSSNWL